MAQGASAAPVELIAALDVPRYLGTWYPVAAPYPNMFQAHCVSDTTATCGLRSDGVIEVVIRCRDVRGKLDEAIGDPRETGTLEVSFLPAWLRRAQDFGHWASGAYWVIQPAQDYRYAVVSEGTRR